MNSNYQETPSLTIRYYLSKIGLTKEKSLSSAMTAEELGYYMEGGEE